ASTLFLKLQRLNRAGHALAKQSKTETLDAKQNMDRLHLSLQNLSYERAYLKKELAKCEDIETSYQNVELVSEDEFMRTAPAILSTEIDPHARMLNRLQFELDERKRLVDEEKELVAKRDALIKENKAKKAELENLDKDLEALVKVRVR
ncbi:THO complex, subunit 5, partial [Blyttiomyces helicus]